MTLSPLVPNQTRLCYISKSADISQHYEAYLNLAKARLNSHFMSILVYKASQECLVEYQYQAN